MTITHCNRARFLFWRRTFFSSDPSVTVHAELHRPASGADGADPVRHPADLLRHRAVRPGGPVERIISQLNNPNSGAAERIGGGSGGDAGAQATDSSSAYRGAQGLRDPAFIKELEKQFGFDKPAHERFLKMLKDYATFDFGRSYFRDAPVLQLIKEKLPVSITLGLWMTLLSYAISIPLGIRKAVKDGSRFDTWTSAGRDRRLCHSELPVRDPADRALRRRLVLADLPLAGPDLGELGAAQPDGQDRRLSLAHRPARSGDGVRGLRDLDLADQELLPRRDPEAIRADGADEGPRSAACSMAMSSATPC